MVTIAHASIDERGKVSGGMAGDNNGKEVCTRSWYDKPWDFVIRFKDPLKREAVAIAMERAAANPAIGYDQVQRNTLLEYARSVGYDPGKVTRKCETDCSALVTLACIYAGVPESFLVRQGNSATTRTLRKWLAETGLVDIFSDKSYTRKEDKLIRGDILLSEGHHVASVTSPRPNYNLTDIAKQVLSGKWGNGEERKRRLTESGYNYSEVQEKINRIIKEGSR